jgi:hypothetical protein
MKTDAQSLWQTPYFLQDTIANEEEAGDSFEFWFSLVGGGAFAHADSYCEMAVSMQLQGRKRWRLGMFPEVNTVFESFFSADRGIYGAAGGVKWRPEYDFRLRKGECLIFPPGYVHETLVEPSSDTASATAEGEQSKTTSHGTHPWTQDQEDRVDSRETVDVPDCSVAATFQFNLPLPVKYIRSFLPRLFHSHLVWGENCHERFWKQLVTFGIEEAAHEDHEEHEVDDERERKGSANDDGRVGEGRVGELSAFAALEARVLARVQHVFEIVDTSGDGMIGAVELESHFLRAGGRGDRGGRGGRGSRGGRGGSADFLRERARGYSWSYDWEGNKARRQKLEALEQELLTTQVGDTVAYHDLDGDGSISWRELHNSTHQWAVLESRMRRLQRLEQQPMLSEAARMQAAKDIEGAYDAKYRCGSRDSHDQSDYCKHNQSDLTNGTSWHRLSDVPLFVFKEQAEQEQAEISNGRAGHTAATGEL